MADETVAQVITKQDNTTQAAIDVNAVHSIRQFAPGAYGGFIGNNFGFMFPTNPDLIPRYGTLECDIALRMMHYTQHNGLVGSATEVFAEKYLSIPFEISGGRNLTFQWQDLFAHSEFGEGYHTLMHESIVDYCTLNRGFFLELVSYGDPDTPLKEGAKILGINHLDALRIQFTGNREWPYLYMSEWSGGLHRLHATRVIHVARQPSPDTLMYGMGKSCLYDAISVANAQVLLGRHQNELLSDLPPPGIVIFSNVKPDQITQAMQQFEYERRRDGQNVYRAPVRLDSLNPEQPATVTFVPMATLPEGFEYDKFMNMHVNLTALAFGLDPQDLWPLTGNNLGTGAQSRVLAAKTDIKGPAHLADKLTPIWNFRVLPRSLEWKYKAANAEQDRQTADIAQVWTAIANDASYMNNNEKRQLIANQVPAFADVLMDEEGQVRLFEDDPKEVDQFFTASDDVEMDGMAGQAEVTADGETQDVMQDVPEAALTNGKQTAQLAPPKTPTKQPTVPAKKPAPPANKQPPNPAVDNKFKEVQDQLKAGLLTMAQAQSAIGVTPDPIYEGMYLVEGFPVPREKLRDLWQAHFGRGVASFDAVVSGETLPTGTLPTANGFKEVEIVRKNIDATNDEFIQEMTAIIQDGIDRTITKAGCAARIRGAIQRYGKQAYLDGLEHGCVDPSDYDEDDARIVADLAVRDSQYVSNLVNDIYSDPPPDMDAESRAQMWMGTSDEFYYAGIESADKNGMYSFEGDDGKESCYDCQRLKGQKHRMSWWVSKELRPGIDHDNFECGGWRCQHYLERVGGC